MSLRLFLSGILAGLMATGAWAQALTPAQEREAARQLLSDDASVRRTAFQKLWQLGDGASEQMTSLLEKADRHRSGQLTRILAGAEPKAQEFKRAWHDWQTHIRQTLTFANEDLGEDKSAFAKLDGMMTKARRLHRAVAKAGGGLSDLREHLEKCGRPLQELRLETAMLAGADEPDPPSLRSLYEDCLDTRTVLTALNAWQDFQTSLAQAEDATRYHRKGAQWPTHPQQTFAQQLNETRQSLGLPVVYLQEHLSTASEEHSSEMGRLGYFSHDSPVKGRRTPWDRAKLASYPHQALGENIFMGDTSPIAAYQAWWRSDGHRKIMLLRQANHLGVALAGRHWTMMMGHGPRPKDTDKDAHSN